VERVLVDVDRRIQHLEPPLVDEARSSSAHRTEPYDIHAMGRDQDPKSPDLRCNELHRFAATREESSATLYAQVYTRPLTYVSSSTKWLQIGLN
jgi:hypothetical protein